MMEWNTWRAFNMLNDGEINANFNFDDSGNPLSTASGNQADIVCNYQHFAVLVEVTLSSGARQYEMEGEPVARHVGQYRTTFAHNVYCIFIAKELNEASIAHFYMLHKTNVRYYGGKVQIIPITIDELIQILTISRASSIKPTAKSIRTFIEYIADQIDHVANETEWRNSIQQAVTNWQSFI